MSNAEADSYKLRILEEVTLGVTPASAMDNLRNTGESLNYNISTSVSPEISGDGQVTDLTQTGANADGAINFNFSFGTYDKLLQAAMRSEFSSDLAIAEITIDADDSDNSYNDSGSGFGSIVAGQWVLVAGFDTAANNGYKKVVSATTAKVIVSATLVTEVAGDSVTIKGSMLRNGSTKKSFSIEKEFTDVTQFLSYTGMRVDTMAMEIASGADLAGSIGFMGLDSARGTSSIGTGAPNAATTTQLLNGVNNVVDILENGAVMADVYIQKLSMDIANNLRPQPAIGSLANIGIGYGKLNVKGSISLYFANGDLYDKYINNTESSLSYRLLDAAGNAYIFTYHRIKYATGAVNAGGENTDVFKEMGFQALKHSTYGCTLQIDKFPV